MQPRRARPGGARSRVEGGASAAASRVRHRDQAAAPDARDRPDLRRQRDRLLRRRPAPDVGGAVHPLQRAAAVDQLGRPRLDGLRPAGRHRRAVRAARTSWSSPSCGDGGFQMSIPELATIANHGLPIKIIVMNNGYLGMVRQWQELFYNNRLCAGDARRLPGRREAGRGVRLHGPHGRRSRRNCGPALGRSGRRAGPVPAERQGDAVRERVPDGARPGGASTRWCWDRRKPVAVPEIQEEVDERCCRSFHCWWRTSRAR